MTFNCLFFSILGRQIYYMAIIHISISFKYHESVMEVQVKQFMHSSSDPRELMSVHSPGTTFYLYFYLLYYLIFSLNEMTLYFFIIITWYFISKSHYSLSFAFLFYFNFSIFKEFLLTWYYRDFALLNCSQILNFYLQKALI